MEPLDIDSDKFKYEACSITTEECCEYSCKTCEIAIGEMEEIKEQENKSVCTFKVKNGNVCVNMCNTVAKCPSLDELMFFVFKDGEKPKFENLISWDVEKIDKEYPHLNIVVEKLNLNPPTEIFYCPEFPLVSNHGNVILAIAPRIEPEDLECE